MGKRIVVAWALVLILVVSGSASEEAVRTSQGEMTIPTYPWEINDINPYFRPVSLGGYSPTLTIYPYPMQDSLSKTKSDRTYKTMILENEYLKVTVIPELGGHVHAVLDKVTGENMLYENKVIKPSLIGLRGAWTSGGIEFNTGPQGHTVTAVSPVSCRFVEHSDGSKAIAIGNVEQVYHTQWVAVVRLRPGRAYLEERIRIYNPTGNKHLYYFWNCVAVPNTPSTQFIYPMTLGSDHWGKEFFDWPIHEGKDISWLKNFDKPSSIFSYRCDQDFYGSYDHDLDRGVIAHANHLELVGKKSWTWSLSRWGRNAQAALTDDGTCYNEIQTGPLPTQADYGVLEPHQAVEWDEWWYPVRGTKGVAFSNKEVTVNVQRDAAKKTTTLLVHGTGALDVLCSIEGLGEQKVKIDPAKAATVVFDDPKNLPSIRIAVKSGGTTLAQFDHPLPLPLRTRPEKSRELPSEETASGCYAKAVHHDKEGGIHLAREWFEKALKKDPAYSPALTALGELDLDAGMIDAARKRLEEALKIDGDDGWAAYYLAQVFVEKGELADALEMAHKATQRPVSAAAAYSLSGAIRMRQGRWDLAVDPLRKSLVMNAKDLVTHNRLAYALWKNGDHEGALRELKEVVSRDPLDMPSAAIGELMGVEEKEFSARIAGRREEVMDLADFFLQSGLKYEAVKALEKYYVGAKVTVKEPCPLPYYAHGILGGDPKSIARAKELGPDCVFPNRRSEFAILEEVCRKDPTDWKARYYLGNLCFERCRKDDAVKLWNEAIEIDDSYSVLHRNLGMVAWKMEKQPLEAVFHYERAHAANPDDLPTCRDLGTLYRETGQYVKARDFLEQARGKRTRADITSLLTQTYIQLGDYRKAVDLLLADNYINWEGQGGLYNLYLTSRIGLGEQAYGKSDYAGALKEFQASAEFPKNLGPGLMGDLPMAETNYWIGLCYERLGRQADADKAFEASVKELEKGDVRNREFARKAKAHLDRKM